MKLYELTESYDYLLNLLEVEADPAHIEEALQVLDDEIDNKATNIAKVLKSLELSANNLKEEERRFKDRRLAIENNIKNLKDYLQENMESLGRDKIKSDLFTINIQNNPPSLLVEDEKEIPDAYWIEQPKKLNKRQLLNDLKSGELEDFKGARIIQKKGLRIR